MSLIMGFGTKDALVARLHAKSVPASRASCSLGCVPKDEGFQPAASRSRTAADHYRRARRLMRRDPRLHHAQGRGWNAPCHDRIKSEPYRMRQDREQWRQFSNSPAIPLPIPLSAVPAIPRQLIDITANNDIDDAFSGAEGVFSLPSGRDARRKAVA